MNIWKKEKKIVANSDTHAGRQTHNDTHKTYTPINGDCTYEREWFEQDQETKKQSWD